MKGWQDYENRQESLPADALEPAGGMSSLAAGSEPDMDAPDIDGDPDVVGPDIEAAAGSDFESAASDPDLDDEGAEDDPDDLMAEIEAALAESSDAVPSGEV